MKKIAFILKMTRCSGKLQIILILGISLLQGIILSLELTVWQQLIDGIIFCLKNNSFNRIFIPIGCYMILAFTNLLLNKISAYINWKYSMQLINYINNELLYKCSRIKYDIYHEAKFYDELIRINDVSAVSIVGIVNGLATLAQYVMAYVSVFVILARYNILIPIVISVLILPLLLYELSYSRKIYDTKCEYTEAERMVGKLSGLFFSYRHIMEIRTYKAFNTLIKKVKEFQNESYNAENIIRKQQVKGEVYINFIYIVSIYTLKLLAVVLSVRQGFTVGVITMYMTSIDQIATDLQSVVSSLTELKVNRLYIESLQSFLEHEEEIPGGKKAGKIQEIRFENVSYKYPGTDKYIFENVSFCLKSPGKYLLQGPNGSGKSTLIKLLAGFYKPDEGEIYINGIKIQELDRDDYYKHLCIMYQEYNRYPLSVRDNITFQNDKSEAGINQMLKEINIYSDIINMKNGMETVIDNEQNNGTELSLGQWQKIAFSRAFFHGGDFFIYDEPAASLDYETTEIIQDILLRESQGKLLVYISHDKISDCRITHDISIQNSNIRVEAR